MRPHIDNDVIDDNIGDDNYVVARAAIINAHHK